MKKRFFLISSTAVLVISILFAHILSVYYRKEIEIEENRMRRYLSSSISLALSVIQDEIIFIYYSISSKLHSGVFTDYQKDININSLLTHIDQLSDDLPRIVNYIYIIKQEELIEYRPLYRSVLNEYELLDNLHQWESLNAAERRDLINIQDLSGFMAYPVFITHEEDKPGIIMFGLSLFDTIWNYLPNIAQMKLRENRIVNGADDIDFEVSIFKGSDLLKLESPGSSDLIIDLNSVFNLQEIETYFKLRNNREFQNITSNAFIAEHNYLVVNHLRGGIDEYYSFKLSRFYFIQIFIVVLVYILVQLLGMTRFISQQNKIREHEFMSLISHELNTPLSVISLSAENLAQGLFSKNKGIEYYGDLISKETIRLRKMINNILLITNHSYKISESDFKYEKIDEIVDDLQKKSEKILDVHQVAMEVRSEVVSSELYCCRHLLVIAIFNVLENSIRYGADYSKKKLIDFRIFNCVREGVWALAFHIRDYGPGIRADEKKKIFQRFYRGKDVSDKQLAGTGLGLSLSRYIAKAHKGAISLIDDSVDGAHFEIWLPVGEKNEKNHDDRR